MSTETLLSTLQITYTWILDAETYCIQKGRKKIKKKNPLISSHQI